MDEHMLNMHKALGSTPSTKEKRKKEGMKKEKEKEKWLSECYDPSKTADKFQVK